MSIKEQINEIEHKRRNKMPEKLYEMLTTIAVVIRYFGHYQESNDLINVGLILRERGIDTVEKLRKALEERG